MIPAWVNRPSSPRSGSVASTHGVRSSVCDGGVGTAPVRNVNDWVRSCDPPTVAAVSVAAGCWPAGGLYWSPLTAIAVAVQSISTEYVLSGVSRGSVPAAASAVETAVWSDDLTVTSQA